MVYLGCFILVGSVPWADGKSIRSSVLCYAQLAMFFNFQSGSLLIQVHCILNMTQRIIKTFNSSNKIESIVRSFVTNIVTVDIRSKRTELKWVHFKLSKTSNVDFESVSMMNYQL